MSEPGQQESTSLENAMEVLELTQATELAQAMEARGDFKFKGIFALFNAILDWTNKFTQNGILPTYEQLERDVQIPPDKLKEYMQELLGRGSSKARLIFALPSVDITSGANSELIRHLIYCRPTKGDGPTVRRYVQAYVDRNSSVLAKWISRRRPETGPKTAEFLHGKIEEGRLHDTQAGAEIARMFYNDLDNTPQHRKITYALITKPVIQKLLTDGHLVLIKPAPNAFLPKYRGIYYGGMEEMEARFRVLAEYFANTIVHDPSLLQGGTTDIHRAATGMDRATFAALPPGAKQCVMEISLMAGKLEKMRNEKKESEVKQSMDTIMGDLSKAGRLVEVDRIKDMNDETRSRIINSSTCLHADYAVSGRVATFVLHKECIPPAVKSARELYDKSGNDTEVQVLNSMNIQKHLNPDELKAFNDLHERTMFDRLPWFTRIWRSMFGKDKIKPAEKEKVRQAMEKAAMEERLRIQKAEARRAQKELASERVKAEKQVKEKAAAAVADEDAEPRELTPEEKQAAVEREAEVAEQLQKITDCLDEAWNQGLMPNRTYLVENVKGFDESTLINFLKKHARKNVFSFRVKNESPKYQWPILISRNYIKRNGRSMLNKAIEDSDKQRKANMPNQEKFDVSSAIEEFLNKILQKSR